MAPAADPAWQPLTKLPNPLFDEIADTDAGKTYVGLGTAPGDVVTNLYRYDADAKTWATLANAADARNAPVHGFVGGCG